MPITEHALGQAERANAMTATRAVFVKGLWLRPSRWDRWAELFEDAGYVALMPGWSDDPGTVADARERRDVFAGKSIGEIADDEASIISELERKPS